MKNLVFMSQFNPEQNLIKEFNYWVVLLREGQVTLGDCIIALKREVSSFGEMTKEESAEIFEVIKWYELTCRSLYGASKFNYIVAMMRDNFVHYHAFPRYSTSLSMYGMEWVDDRWPRVIQFGESQCDSRHVFDLIVKDMRDANLQ